jgi:hypothetical protein
MRPHVPSLRRTENLADNASACLALACPDPSPVVTARNL